MGGVFFIAAVLRTLYLYANRKKCRLFKIKNQINVNLHAVRPQDIGRSIDKGTGFKAKLSRMTFL